MKEKQGRMTHSLPKKTYRSNESPAYAQEALLDSNSTTCGRRHNPPRSYSASAGARCLSAPWRRQRLHVFRSARSRRRPHWKHSPAARYRSRARGHARGLGAPARVADDGVVGKTGRPRYADQVDLRARKGSGSAHGGGDDHRRSDDTPGHVRRAGPCWRASRRRGWRRRAL